MTTTVHRAVVLLLLSGPLAAAAAPAPMTTNDTIKDRASFMPYRKYQALPGRAVGVLASDVRAKMAHEGRAGAADNLAFSAGGNSYRWVYVPVQQNPEITNLQVKVGAKGDQVQVYPRLSMASPRTVRQWGITVPYALVEVEVNGGQGAPPGEGFVATKMRRLDGTRDYPLEVTKVVRELHERYAAWKAGEKQKLDAALAEAQRKALKDRRPTGPRETAELFYITWLPESQRLRVHFRTTITDGEYRYRGGAGRRRPFPPPPPGRIPPPPRDLPRVRHGTSFGIEFGKAYEVDRQGKVVRTLTLPAQPFKRVLPPVSPPTGAPPGR